MDEEEEDDLLLELDLLHDTARAWLERASEADSPFDEASCVEEAIGALQEAVRLERSNQGTLSEVMKLQDRIKAIARANPDLSAHGDGDSLFAAALRLDHADGDLEEAMKLYLDATQIYIKASQRKGALKLQKEFWRRRADNLLTRVEELKYQIEQEREADQQSRALANSTLETYTEEELDVLRESSRINGCIFLPWVESEDSELRNFTFKKKFEDPDGKLTLSALQRRNCAGWARAWQICGENPVIFAGKLSALHVVQEYVADCSFVSSLCIVANYERRTGKRLLSRIIYPQDETAMPFYNPSGKYVVKLWYNGVARQVVVDDFFPVTEDRQWLCSFSLRRNELWVSIIEKAYMKLNGGFNFEGSVSGIDTYCLTGWIPENHDLREEMEESIWKQLVGAYTSQDCLLTVASGALDDNDGIGMGLIPKHAYAVLRVAEIDDGGLRFLQLKNPWSRSRWKGAFCPEDSANWTEDLKIKLNYDNEKAAQKDNGIFWIELTDVRKYFRMLYLNWNPDLFEHKLVVHREWPQTTGPQDDTFTVAENPQFVLKFDEIKQKEESGSQGLVWVLLSRHVTDWRQLLDDDKGNCMALNIYDRRNGKRVYYPEDPMLRGAYSNNPHCLMSFQPKPGHLAYTLVVSLLEKMRAMNYTLTVYASSHCVRPVLEALPDTLEFSEEICHKWDARTAGGCPKYASYMDNPQYKIVFKEPCAYLHLRLLAHRTFPVNLRLFDAAGKKVDFADPSKLLTSSGNYRKGFCMLERIFDEEPLLQDRPYTVVPSAFTPGLQSNFYIHVEATVPFELFPLPAEGDGFANEYRIEGAWQISDGTAAGCPNYGTYSFNPVIEIVCERNFKFLARMLHVPESENGSSQSWPSLNLSLFNASSSASNSGEGLDDAFVVSNEGIYMNPPSGAVIEECDIDAGKHILVPSTFKPFEGKFEIKIFSSEPLYITKRPPKGPPPPGMQKKPQESKEKPQELEEPAKAFPLPDFVKVANRLKTEMEAEASSGGNGVENCKNRTAL